MELPFVTRSRTDYRWRVAAVVGLISTLVLGGCRSLGPLASFRAPGDVASDLFADDDSDTRPAAPWRKRQAERSLLTETLADDGWIRTSGAAAPGWTAGGRRWRHPASEELLAAGGEQPDWSRYLNDANPVVAASAAILLARQQDDRGLDVLAETVRTRPMEMRIRQAAAESLMGLPGQSALETLQALVDQYGGLASSGQTSYIAELHAELLRSLSGHVHPSLDSRFEDALRSPSAEVRLAALAAWADAKPVPLPQQVIDIRTDADARVRAAALELIAARQVEGALEYLRAGLRDYDGSVRLAAVRGLGLHSSEEALGELTKILRNGPERVRAAAVEALAMLGAEAELVKAADDSAWRVRRAAARALAGQTFASRPSEQCQSTIEKLLEDSSAMVQQEAVAVLGRWPLDSAGPLLLQSIESSAYRARVAAAADLASRWPPAREFLPDASAERRAEVLAKLKQTWNGEHTEDLAADPSASAAKFDPFDHLDPETVVLVEEALARLSSAQQPDEVHRKAREQLQGLGPELVALVEYVAIEKKRPLPEAVYRELLPWRSEVFAALERLASSDAVQHRKAAAQLARLSGEQTLRPLALARLAELMRTQDDPLVWQSVFRTIAADGTEPSILLAYAAIGHRTPEVRRQACEYLARHADPSHADVLLPALRDEHPAVVQAAIRAVAESGAYQATATLEELLASSDRQTRLEAAWGLARLGSPRGAAALERLAYDPDPVIRVQAASAMGELGEATFAPVLVRLLDDSRLGVRRAALGSLKAIVGHDVAAEQETAGNSPDTAAPSIDEAIYRWKRWWEREGSSGLVIAPMAERRDVTPAR